MKGAYIAGATLFFLIVIAFFVMRGGNEPKTPLAPEDELNKLKEKLKEVEGYREYYRSDGNNGLTVGGTILEQGIDVLVEILKQPLVKEFTQKVIQNREDAVFIAEQIEILGKEFVTLLKDKQILKCGSPLVKTCKNSGSEEVCTYAPVETEPPLDNCKVYRPDKENIKYISDTLSKKALDIINDDTKRPEIYATFKNITMSNYQLLHYATGNDEFAKKIEGGFPSEEEFFTQMNNLNRKVRLPAAKSISEDVEVPEQVPVDEAN